MAAGEPLLGTGSQSDVASTCCLSPVIQLEPSHPVPQSAEFVHLTDVFRSPPSGDTAVKGPPGSVRRRGGDAGAAAVSADRVRLERAGCSRRVVGDRVRERTSSGRGSLRGPESQCSPVGQEQEGHFLRHR